MSGRNPIPTPLAYAGVQASNPPDVTIATRAPTSNDKKPIGQLWINKSTQTAYQLSGYSSGSPVWVALGGSGAASSVASLTSAGAISATNGNLSLGTAGNKIVIAAGTNASVGTTAAMTAGVVTTATTASSATALIFYCRKVTGGTPGNVSITAQDGTGFTLTSTSATETSTFNYWIINA